MIGGNDTSVREHDRKIWTGGLRVLVVEDSEDDALLLLRELRRGGYEPRHERVETPEAMEAALGEESWDVVISDHAMPHFSAPAALKMLQEKGLDLPFIIVSGKIGEEAAVAAMRAGARDYVPKDNLARLNAVVERELREAEIRQERERAQKELRRSEERFRRLVEQAADAVFVHDLEGRFVDVNRRACESLGYTREGLLKLSVPDVEVGSNRGSLPELWAKITSGESRTLEGTHRRKDGTTFPVEVRVGVFESEGRQLILALARDITERKRAEEELVRLASYPMLNPGPVIEAGVTGDPTYLNPAGEKLFPDMRTLGRRHPLLAGLGSVARKMSESGGRQVVHEVRVDDRFYLESISPVPDTNLLRIYAMDITERRRAEDALRQSEERYRSFIEQSTEGIWRFELERPIPVSLPEDEQIEHFYRYAYLAECNDALARMYGRARAEEVVGARSDELLPRSDTENLECLKAFIRSGYRLIDAESREVDRDGNAKFFLNNLTGMVENGLLVRVWGTQRDITEQRKIQGALRQSEERYRTVVEQAAGNIFMVDIETRRIIDANAAFHRSLGYSSDELRHMTLYDVVAHDRESIDRNIRGALKAGRYSIGERKYRRNNGSVAEMEVAVSVIPYRGREALCVVAHDITERKRTERALRETRKAEQLRIARDLHDTVLQDVVYAIQQIDIREIAAEDADRGARLREISESLRRAVEDLRTVVFELRLEGAREGSVVSSLESLVELSRRMAQRKFTVGLTVEKGFPRKISERARMELTYLVREALTNSRRHSGARHVEVTLGVKGERLWVEVADDGRGFDPEASHTGMGTVSMRQRALGLGGELKILSHPGEGTRVRFEAPSSHLLQTLPEIHPVSNNRASGHQRRK